MNTISDLRRSLEETAHSHDAPDPSTLLRGVQDDIATGRDRGNRTPRLVAAAAAVALVAGGGWALSQGLGEDASSVAPAQSWELVDGAPPEYAAGLALVDTVELTADSQQESLAWDGDGQGFALAWCDISAEPGAAAIALTPEGAEGAALGCSGGAGSEAGGPMPVPAGEAFDVQLVEAAAGAVGRLEGDDTVLVGLYREASINEYPYPMQQDIPAPPEHDVVLDKGSPPADRADLVILGEGSDNALQRAVTVESFEGTTLTTWAGEPGRLLVAVDGTVITNDGEELSQPTGPGPWEDADPDLRGGYWHAWATGATTREFDLSPTGLAAHGIQVSEGDTVTVLARDAFPRNAWQVGIDQPEGAERAGVSEIGPTEQLPEFAYGMRLVSATEIPADGAVHLVDLGDADAAEVLWVPTCPESMPGASVTIANRPTRCAATVGWAQTVRAPEVASDEPVEVRVAAGGETVQLGAYLPVEWDGYPFAESGTPMADDGGLGVVVSEQPVEGSRPADLTHAEARAAAVYREVATVSSGDLDAEGRAELTVPSSTDLSVWVASSGPARVALEIDGVALGESLDGQLWPSYPLLRDGWYSAWTTDEAGTELRFDTPGDRKGHALRDNPTVTVQVEAVDGAEVELTFYEFIPEQ